MDDSDWCIEQSQVARVVYPLILKWSEKLGVNEDIVQRCDLHVRQAMQITCVGARQPVAALSDPAARPEMLVALARAIHAAPS